MNLDRDRPEQDPNIKHQAKQAEPVREMRTIEYIIDAAVRQSLARHYAEQGQTVPGVATGTCPPPVFGFDHAPHRGLNGNQVPAAADTRMRERLQKLAQDRGAQLGGYPAQPAPPPVCETDSHLRDTIRAIEAEAAQTLTTLGSFADQVQTLVNNAEIPLEALSPNTADRGTPGDWSPLAQRLLVLWGDINRIHRGLMELSARIDL